MYPSDELAGDLRDLFFESAQELLQIMNESGLSLEENPGDSEKLREVRRAVHTLKGDSAACGFRQLSELAHTLEDALTPELAAANPDRIADIILTAADTFHEMLSAYRNKLQPPAGEALRGHIQRLLKGDEVQETKSAEAKFEWTEYERLGIADALRREDPVYEIALYLDTENLLPAAAYQLAKKAVSNAGRIVAFHPESAETGQKIEFIETVIASGRAEDAIRRMIRVPAVVSEVTIRKMAQDQARTRDALDVLLESEASAVATSVKSEGKPYDGPERRENSSANGSHNENSLRVDAGRIDTVMNLVGELIIGKSMLQRAIAEFELRHGKDSLRAKFLDTLAFQSRILGELQKSVMKIRMVPVEQLFRRFPRIVRDVAKQRNKDIDLEIAGQNTDLDKGILDTLAEPLAHLVRNAADHGIETAEERIGAGKPGHGTIRLNAYHEGDQVVIEVSDDGKGLDRKKIVAKAVASGIITKDQSERLNESESLDLVFTPGLSTADTITEISGRGVGLDVVKAAVENLKGSVKVETVPGHGATFRLLVPLTLASIQALLFRVGGRLYAVPLASVVEITRMVDVRVHRVDDREVFQLRDQVLPLIRLDGLGPRIVNQRPERTFVVIISAGSRKFGLAVDSLFGEDELVIKALEDNLVTSPLVSGASILGDGTVVLILNVPAVVAQLSKAAPLGAIA